MILWREVDDKYEVYYKTEHNEIPLGQLTLDPVEDGCLSGYVGRERVLVCFRGRSDSAYRRALKRAMVAMTTLAEAYVAS